jgi:hypothetical protein
MREQFETWLKRDFPEADTSKRLGEYINSSTRAKWEGYQAGRQDGYAHGYDACAAISSGKVPV